MLEILELIDVIIMIERVQSDERYEIESNRLNVRIMAAINSKIVVIPFLWTIGEI